MSIANNIDYGGAFSLPCSAGAALSELEVMRMSTVSAVPQGDERFEQGGQRRAKKHASSHDFLTLDMRWKALEHAMNLS